MKETPNFRTGPKSGIYQVVPGWRTNSFKLLYPVFLKLFPEDQAFVCIYERSLCHAPRPRFGHSCKSFCNFSHETTKKKGAK